MDQSLENQDSILDQIDQSENDVNTSINLNQSISLIFPESIAKSVSEFMITSDHKLKIICKFFRKQIEQIFMHYKVQAIYKGDYVLLQSQNQDYDFTTVKNQINKLFVELVIDPYPTNDQNSVKTIYSSPFIIQGLRSRQIFFVRQKLENHKQLITFYYMTEQKEFFKIFKASFRGIRLFFHKNQAIFNQYHPEQIEMLEPIVQIQIKYYRKFMYEHLGNLSFVNSINILNENEHHASQTIALSIQQYNSLTQDKIVEQLSAYIKLKIESLFYFKIGYKSYNSQDIENMKKLSDQINNLQKDNKFLATSTYNINKQYLIVIGDDEDIIATLDHLTQYLTEINFSDEFRKFICLYVYTRNLNFSSIRQSDRQVEQIVEQIIKSQDIIHLHKNALEWVISLKKSYSMKNYIKTLQMIATNKQKISYQQSKSDLEQIWNYLNEQSGKFQRRQLFADNQQMSPLKNSSQAVPQQNIRQNQERYRDVDQQSDYDLNFNESILTELQLQHMIGEQFQQPQVEEQAPQQQFAQQIVQKQDLQQQQFAQQIVQQQVGISLPEQQVQIQQNQQVEKQKVVQNQQVEQYQQVLQPQPQQQVQRKIQQQIQQQDQQPQVARQQDSQKHQAVINNKIQNNDNIFSTGIVEKLKLMQNESFIELFSTQDQPQLQDYYVYQLVLTSEFNVSFRIIQNDSDLHLKDDIKSYNFLYSQLKCTKDRIFEHFKQIDQSTVFTKNLNALLVNRDSELIIVSFPSKIAEKADNQILDGDYFQLKYANSVYPKYAICKRN